jgi:hypothetical protein
MNDSLLQQIEDHNKYYVVFLAMPDSAGRPIKV